MIHLPKDVRVVCAFSGTGKSTFAAKHSGVEDLGYSGFVHSPDFPENYLKATLRLVKDGIIVLTGTHVAFVHELDRFKIKYAMIYPNPAKKKEFEQLHMKRGDDKRFMNNLFAHWTEWLNDCKNSHAVLKIMYEPNQHLSDLISV